MNPVVDESVLLIRCGDEEIVGVLSRPSAPLARRLGVLIAVGGPQYRVGSHRQFVLLARQLARHGYAVLRIDYRGMGDSTGAMRSFTDVEDDLRTGAKALLDAVPDLEGFVVWGLCDAASAALMFAPALSGCTGLILLNPWVRSDETLAKTHLKHYYGARLLQPDFWRKMFSGRFNVSAALRSFAGSLRLALLREARSTDQAATGSYIDKMLAGITRFRGKMLLVLSGNDLTAKEFEDLTRADARWRRALANPQFSQRRIDGADHTFSNAVWRGAVEKECIEWLERLSLGSRSN